MAALTLRSGDGLLAHRQHGASVAIVTVARGKIRGMSQGFGGELPRTHIHTSHRKPARYLVMIESGGSGVARLFLESLELVAEFDAGTEEAAQMTAGLVPTNGADGPEWDQALEGHSAPERRAARVYRLEV